MRIICDNSSAAEARQILRRNRGDGQAEARAEETPFRWRNCRADIEAWRHSITVELYLNDVVFPALEKIATKAVRVGQSDIPGGPSPRVTSKWC